MKTLSFAVCLVLSVTGGAVCGAESLLDEPVLDSLRIVEDPDGYTNVRSGPSTKSKVVGKVLSGAVVAIEPEQQGDWALLYFHDTTEESRYIHSSRLKSVKSWKQHAVTKADADNMSGVLSRQGFEARVQALPFVAKDHRITRDKQGMHKVDGEWPWGRDGDLPAFSLSLAVTQGGRAVPIPKEATNHLYEPSMDTMVLVTPGDPAQHALLVMLNGDGAGGYCVVWAFQAGKYRGRAVFSPF
ncbi:MAG: SH3 domain-containing protein [Verrucomicrobiaceae bacterium]|nr:SH3 domain-containing protein [Verrucomicrobiaceae bacterium]